jgi:hypothetical protein
VASLAADSDPAFTTVAGLLSVVVR